MEMTPAQKNEFLSRRKLQQKKEAEIEAAKRDPQTIILERKQPACKAYQEGKTQRQESLVVTSLKPQSQTRIKPDNKDLLGDASETLAFKQTLQWTFQQYHKLNKFYESEQLKEKLKDRGSLYGVPSTEFSQEKEIAELIQKMPAMITKPNNLFDKGELEKKYKIFMQRTRQIQEEEEMKRQL